jgi:hypothetical protein
MGRQRVGYDEAHRLLTNLLEPEEFLTMELIMEYHERWEEELILDEQKTHQDPCRAEKTTNLRSETTVGLRQELYAMSLGHFVVRALMLEAATKANVDVDRLSFKGSFQTFKTRLPECDPSNEVKFTEWYLAVVLEIGRERIPPRRNRINLRVIKRKMTSWNECRTKHRKLQPLTKASDHTVVMLR